MQVENSFNRLQLKALLLDTITFLKFGKHLAPNYRSVKKSLCEMVGQKSNITAKQTLHMIGLVYRDNKLESDFWATIDSHNASKFLD